MNKRQKNIIICLVILAMGMGIIGGLVIGMLIQQMIFVAGAVEIAEGLEGTNIEINIDINETKLVEGFTKFINETLQEEVSENLHDD